MNCAIKNNPAKIAAVKKSRRVEQLVSGVATSAGAGVKLTWVLTQSRCTNGSIRS